MTEPQDFESLDELFRKTFDHLPETPAPSGWDRPSERVWQHVQTTIQAPQNGWSAKAITLVSALAVTVAIGLYLFVIRPEPVAETTTPVAQPVLTAPVIATPAATEIIAAVPVPEKTTSAKQIISSHIRPQQKQVVKPTLPAEISPAGNQRPSGSIPLPGSKAVAPNNTVANLEQLWQTPLETLPVLPEKVNRSTPAGFEKN